MSLLTTCVVAGALVRAIFAMRSAVTVLQLVDTDAARLAPEF